MHVLLPPSEAKTGGGRGRAFGTRLVDPTDPLSAARRTVTDALLQLVAGPADRAAAALLLPAGRAEEALATNAAVLDSRTTPALRRYSGIVYEGLGFSALEPDVQRQAGRRVWVFSGLLGLVRGDEPVPNYRVPAKSELPGVGVAGTYWRRELAGIVPGLMPRGLIIDLRSGDYAVMWRPDAGTARRVVTARVLSPAPRGGHAVISHTSKLMKGRLAAALLRAAAQGSPATSPQDVIAAWIACGGADAVDTGTGRLDLYTR